MLKVLPREPIPDWLIRYSPGDPIDFQAVFNESVYYPACYFDFDVLNLCVGFSHSFVYVDNFSLYSPAATKEDVYESIRSRFWGYRPIFQCEFSQSQMAGKFDYRVEPLQRGDGVRDAGLPAQPFFAILSILEPIELSEATRKALRVRSPESTRIDVNERFAFLYICDDGLDAFQNYYLSHRVRPKGIAIIEPGDAFGGNWTSYRKETAVFSRTVRSNPAGVPELLVVGGRDRWGSGQYRQKLWSDYPYRNYYFRDRGKAIGTWSRTKRNSTDKYILSEESDATTPTFFSPHPR